MSKPNILFHVTLDSLRIAHGVNEITFSRNGLNIRDSSVKLEDTSYAIQTLLLYSVFNCNLRLDGRVAKRLYARTYQWFNGNKTLNREGMEFFSDCPDVAQQLRLELERGCLPEVPLSQTKILVKSKNEWRDVDPFDHKTAALNASYMI